MEYPRARKYISKLNDTELKEMIALASQETSNEGKLIFFLLLSELEHRKAKSLMTKFNN